jgi:TPR repeat protein
MTTARLIPAISLAACLSTSALAQIGATPHDPGGFDQKAQSPPKKAKADPEGIAEDLRLKGRCNDAIAILRPLASGEEGYAVSQYNLGLCLFDLAKADTARAAELNKEGASWVLRAANSGYGKAEAQAVLLYLDGTGVTADPVEAKKWALLYHGNGMRLALGLPDIAPDVASRLDAVMTAPARAEARSRAASWTATGSNSDQ